MIKELQQTICPSCFKKLIKVFTDEPGLGSIYLYIKNFEYKKEIKKIEKSNDVNFIIKNNKDLPIKSVRAISFNQKSLSLIRLKLNNKMIAKKFIPKTTNRFTFSMYICSDDNCNYYKYIDDVTNDFTTN